MYIYKAGVCGGGTMGAEIAQTISFAGLPVVIKDVTQEAVDNAIKKARGIYQRRVDKGKMSQEQLEQKMALISGGVSNDIFKDADIVIEAVPEDLELKKKTFQELDRACSEGTILATNTSAFSISALGAATKRAHKVIGMHFFYPAHVMKLVEVIPGLATSEETINDTVTFSESLRKIPIRVNECAGFLVNRLLMPYLNEAAFCLQQGVAEAKDIDKAVVDFGLPMGPFTLVDNLGIDVCVEVVKVLMGSYGIRMEPARIWQKLYECGRYGVKKEKGFYLYGENLPEEDTELAGIVSSVNDKTSEKFDLMRLLAPMINEAAICLQENVASAADIDISMLAGLGFPEDKKGILHYADTIGIDIIFEKLLAYYQKFGERFWPAPLLRRMVDAGFTGVKAGRGFFEYS